MNSFSNEFHLLITLAINAIVWWSAYRFIRTTRGCDRLSAASDALLLGFLIQYLSVTIPGLFGILSTTTMIGSAVVLSILFDTLSLRERAGVRVAAELAGSSSDPNVLSIRSFPHPNRDTGVLPRGEGTIAVFSTMLVLAYLGILIHSQNFAPPLGDDGMIYHMPAAIQWLHSGSIGIYHTWFVNPANTYSPLGGSTFIAFLLGPMGNDIAARNCQIPALLLIYFAMIDLLRSMGVRPGIASLFAAAAVLCRPFVSQTILVKDDLYLAAFFMIFVSGCARERLSDRLGPWRLGVSLGLMLSTKYTALMALPILLLLIDSPIRARWSIHRWSIFVVLVATLAGPWFVRNWIVTGNPLFPIPITIAKHTVFAGLFSIARSTEMASFDGVWQAFTQKYHELSAVSLVLLIVIWLVAAGTHFKSLLQDPLRRVCIVGSLLGMLIFIFGSHAAEIRYTYTSLLLLFAAAALVGNTAITISIASILLIASLATVFVYPDIVATFGSISLGVAVLSVGFSHLLKRFGRPLALVSIVALLLVSFWWIYVNWTAFVLSSDKNTGPFWADRRGSQGALWDWARSNLPLDARIAVANTVLPYPLLGQSFTRTLEYVPTRRALSSYHDLPRTSLKLTDQLIRPWVAEQLSSDPDWDQWLDQLRTKQIQYLYVERQAANTKPIEIDFANSHPEQFQKLFENDSGCIYQVR